MSLLHAGVFGVGGTSRSDLCRSRIIWLNCRKCALAATLIISLIDGTGHARYLSCGNGDEIDDSCMQLRAKTPCSMLDIRTSGGNIMTQLLPYQFYGQHEFIYLFIPHCGYN